MGCTFFSGDGFVGHISHADYFVSLEPFGAKVWCEYHTYLGPSFFRSEAALKEIRVPSKKTWCAFSNWLETIKDE